MQLILRIFIIGFLCLAGVSQAKHMDEASIDERTRPVGKVNIAGTTIVAEPAAQPVEEATPPEAETTEVVAVAAETDAVATEGQARSGPSRTGEELYNTYCVACHSVGLANAPKVGDAAAWGKILEPGMDAVISSAKKGKNVMPPMGTCVDCSDEELIGAIQFMSGTK